VATDEFEETEAFDAGGDDDDLEIDSLDELEELEDDADDDDGDDDFEGDEVIPDVAEAFADAEEEDDEDEDEDEDADEAGDDDDEEDVEEEDEEDDEAEESLDVLLTREKVLDEDDLGREGRDDLIATTPIGAGEFTCRSCFLVKRRAQLADEERMICYDCA
jgi:hypothetical protein